MERVTIMYVHAWKHHKETFAQLILTNKNVNSFLKRKKDVPT
jgi:hypothetical protein